MVVTIDKCLNITPGLTAPLVVHCSQGDTGLQLSFGIRVGREPFDPTGCIVSAHGVRQDGAGWGPVECTVVDKRVVLDLPAAATAVRGTGMAEIMITRGSTTVGTANFGIMVEVATFPEGVTADDDMSVYQSILEYTQKLGSPLVAETAADMTDTSRTYVYTGTETGYTNGNWYYYDGSAWVSGGIYGSVAPEGEIAQSVAAAAQSAATASAAETGATAAAETASSAAGTATSAATTATDAATSASGSADTATAAAATATDKAAEAAQSAAEAAESETYAHQYAQSAGSAASAALDAKDAAESAAGAAATSKGYAEDYATVAHNAAVTATNAANAATVAAGTAGSSASTAQDAANTATQKASEAAQSATTASGAADTATTKASEAAASAAAAAQSAASLTVDTELSSTSTNPVQNKVVDAAVTELKNDLTEAQNDIEAAQGEIETLKDTAYIVNTAEGDIAVFSDGAAADAKSLVINIEPIQSGTGDPSPDNIRPISGRTGATVWRTGKNLLPNTPGVSAGNNYQYYKNDGITLKPGTYTIKIFSDVAPTFLYIRPIGSISEAIAQINGGEMSFTVSDTVTVWIDAYWSGGTGKPATAPNIQLEPGTTATDYTPYTGTTIPVSWETEAGTVYGGELDVVSGVLTVDRGIVDLGSLNWQYQESGTAVAPYYFATVSALNIQYEGIFAAVVYNLLCPIYKAVRRASATFVDYTICTDGNTTNKSVVQIQIKDPRYESPADLKASLVGVPLVYKLATPQTYQLTPQQIQTLLGENVIYSDAGSVDVEYRADTKKYVDDLFNSLFNSIQSNIAFIEDGTTASRAYTVGQYVIVNGTMYRVAAAIASGATFTPGTNIVATTVGTELTALNA